MDKKQADIMYNNIVHSTISYCIDNQLPFSINLNTKNYKDIIPVDGANEVISFAEWNLEIAEYDNYSLSTILVYNDIEYPIIINFIDILATANSGFSVVANQAIITDIDIIVDEIEALSNQLDNRSQLLNRKAIEYEENNKKGIEHSNSILKLLKKGSIDE